MECLHLELNAGNDCGKVRTPRLDPAERLGLDSGAPQFLECAHDRMREPGPACDLSKATCLTGRDQVMDPARDHRSQREGGGWSDAAPGQLGCSESRSEAGLP